MCYNRIVRTTTILFLTFSALIILGSCNIAYAQDDIGQSKIHPAHPLYFLKAVRESLEMHFAQTPNVKMLRQLEFATRRLREVKSLIFENRQDLIAANLERYWFHMNTVLEYRPREEWLILILRSTIASHIDALEKIYKQVEERSAKISIRSVIFRVITGSDIPKEDRQKGCRFLAKEATSSALNEVERAILRERAILCSKNG